MIDARIFFINSRFLSNEKNENVLNLIKNKSNNHIFIIKKTLILK